MDGRMWWRVVKMKRGQEIDSPYSEGEEVVKMAKAPSVNVQIPMATVKYGLGLTLNVGNYESVRVEYGIELPSPVDSVEDVWDMAVEMVDARVEGAARKVREDV